MMQELLESQRAQKAMFVVYTTILTILLLIPGSQLPGFVGRNDKLIHFIFFAGFSFLLALALWGNSSRIFSTGWSFWYPALIAASYAATMELVQTLVPGRSVSLLDWVAGSLGGLVGALAYAQTFRPRTRKCDQLPANYW